MKKIRSATIIFLLVLPLWISAAVTERHKPAPLSKTGNFAHKIFPAGIFSFGQNIVDGRAWVLYPTFTQVSHKNSSTITLTPSILYGISNHFSFYAGLPLVRQKDDGQSTQWGVGNLFTQLEYALFQKQASEAQDMVTVVGNVTFPTQHLSPALDCYLTSTTVNPFSAFAGVTYSRLTINWYFYAEVGATVYAKKDYTKPGTALLYGWGIGHDIPISSAATVLGVLEFNGQYTKKTDLFAVEDQSTGGHVLHGGPSICITSNWLLVSAGIQVPLYQHLNGCQEKERFRSAIDLFIQF